MNNSPNTNKDLLNILHPYIFVLKEGSDIKDNFLDYSLLMLKISSPEIISSPGSKHIMKFAPTALLISSQLAKDAASQTNDPF